MYYFLISDHGGGGRAVKLWPKIEKILQDRGISYNYWKSSTNAQAASICQSLCASGDKDARLVVLGGDGTINAVLNGIPDFSKLKFGVLPTGSGNDFARGIGSPKNYRKALERILSCGSGHSIDLGRVTFKSGEHGIKEQTKIFGISCGIGMDAIIGRKADLSKSKKLMNKLGLGKFIYFTASVSTLLSLEKTNVSLLVDGNEKRFMKDVFYLAFMNCHTEGGGIQMAPGAKNDDGLLTVGIASEVTTFQAFGLFPKILAGKQNSDKHITQIDCRSMEIEFASPQTLHTDGESFTGIKSAKIEILPKILTVLS